MAKAPTPKSAKASAESTGTRRRPRSRAKPEAAFFDLDRTLLGGASGPIFSEALREVGVLAERRNPLEPLLFKMFDLVGENYPTMLLAREGIRMVRGWPVGAVDDAAALAAPRIVERILPFAHVEIAEHHAAGRRVVMATTTPQHLVAPLADILGIDDVIATRYGVDRTGDTATFDGTIDGPFVWGRGKARAVREFAEAKRIDLAASYAYSDSYYDIPMLSMVGHPTAVNPDPRLFAFATLRRWPLRSFDAPPGVLKIAGLEPQLVAQRLARQEFMPFVRFRCYGKRRVPATGPAIIVAKHRSYFDPLALGYLLAQSGRPIRFLGKREVFDAPIVGDVARAMGGIRVDRGTGSDEPLRAAVDALHGGDLVALMPQGTIPRGRELYNPVLRGRWGAARLAAESRAPVIPVGLWGTEHVWPRSSTLPNVANIINPPTVQIRVGPPVELRYDDVEADTQAIMDAIVRLLPPSARDHYDPTPEEIRLATPHGSADSDASREAGRRPGTD
ncbi:MAG: HAD-IB family hydrolase [Microthrixaceae bacterium]